MRKVATTQINTAQNATKNRAFLLWLSLGAALLAGCASRPMPTYSPAPAPAPAPVLAGPVPAPVPAPPPAVVAAPAAPSMPLVASMNDYRRRAANLIIASNPGASYSGPVPNPSPGIAVVTVMLNADGSIRALDLMRGSSLSPHVNSLALAAARRVGNYGPISNLPGPWQFNETFIFNAADKFQLDTIVSGR